MGADSVSNIPELSVEVQSIDGWSDDTAPIPPDNLQYHCILPNSNKSEGEKQILLRGIVNNYNIDLSAGI
jgi:hypothetical protein